MHLRAALLCPLVSFALVVAPAADAASKGVDEATATEKKEAGSAYADAMADFDKGLLDKALAGFRQSYRQVKSPNSHFMIARTLARLGRNTEAYAELDAVIAEADALGNRYTETGIAARQKREEIRPRIGHLTVRIAHAPKGTTVTVAGDAIDAARLGKPLPVLPGETKVVVTPPGSAAQSFTKTLQAGETGELGIDLGKTADDAKTEVSSSHPRYHVEGELHFGGETLDPPGDATRGAGPGARLSLELSRTGLLGAGDSVALTSGADWIVTGYGHHAWVPLAIQWNIWVLPELSLMVEPGLALMVGQGTYGRPALDVGARYHLFRKVFAIGRVGVPGATIGVSILL